MTKYCVALIGLLLLAGCSDSSVKQSEDKYVLSDNTDSTATRTSEKIEVTRTSTIEEDMGVIID